MRTTSRSAALLALAAAGMAASAIPGARVLVVDDATSLRAVTGHQAKPTPATPAAKLTPSWNFEAWWRGGARATCRSGYPNGPGWTNRHVQRMARKRRNVIRHRKASR